MKVLYKLLSARCSRLHMIFKRQEALFKFFCMKEGLGPHVIKVYELIRDELEVS